ncbi:MAG TPA: FAD-dependent oxidoreductase, partial [Vicinamibacterales bacterium]|nr:FAD-dependent oxidoreductase [Vicinamibacterales bacterium]
MRPRDPERVASTTYDLLVVGGGIHGLTIAYEAASRGLRTALVEMGDYGSGSSFNHQKTVHGGLRALQSMHFAKAREAVRERRALARIAPWLLRPLPFLLGTYRSLLRSRPALKAAFQLDAWIGRDRNAGVEPELHLPAARLISKAATLRLFPGVRRDGLTGGAQWYDYQMVQADRLTIAFAAAADRAGADLLNYAEAVSAVREQGRVAGIRIRDALGGAEADLRAAVVVNAAGSGAGRLMEAFGLRRPLPLLKAMNLVTSKPASDIALAAPTRGGRMLTLVPWNGRALIGTSQSSQPVGASDARVTSEDVDAFVRAANEAFPALQLRREDVTLVHRGLVPAVSRGHATDLLARSQILDHEREGAPGAISVIGAKYTTARGTAERTVDLVARKLRRRIAPSRTGVTVLPGAGIADHEALIIETARAAGLPEQGIAPATIRRLGAQYGELSALVVRLMAEDTRLRSTLVADQPAVAAEVVYAVRHEMAVRLSDIVIRRLALGAAGHPGAEVIRA